MSSYLPVPLHAAIAPGVEDRKSLGLIFQSLETVSYDEQAPYMLSTKRPRADSARFRPCASAVSWPYQHRHKATRRAPLLLVAAETQTSLKQKQARGRFMSLGDI